MSDTELDFGNGSWEEAGGTVRTTLIALHKDVNGNGKPGLKSDVSDMLAYGKASIYWLKGIAALLTIAVALAAVYVARH